MFCGMMQPIGEACALFGVGKGVRPMKSVSLVTGMVLFVIGIHWIVQGLGYFPYPRDSIMYRDIYWSYYGAAVTALGYVVIRLARRNSV